MRFKCCAYREWLRGYSAAEEGGGNPDRLLDDGLVPLICPTCQMFSRHRLCQRLEHDDF